MQARAEYDELDRAVSVSADFSGPFGTARRVYDALLTSDCPNAEEREARIETLRFEQRSLAPGRRSGVTDAEVGGRVKPRPYWHVASATLFKHLGIATAGRILVWHPTAKGAEGAGRGEA